MSARAGIRNSALCAMLAVMPGDGPWLAAIGGFTSAYSSSSGLPSSRGPSLFASRQFGILRTSVALHRTRIARTITTPAGEISAPLRQAQIAFAAGPTWKPWKRLPLLLSVNGVLGIADVSSPGIRVPGGAGVLIELPARSERKLTPGVEFACRFGVVGRVAGLIRIGRSYWKLAGSGDQGGSVGGEWAGYTHLGGGLGITF